MADIFIAISTDGEYADRSVMLIGAFRTESAARQAVDALALSERARLLARTDESASYAVSQEWDRYEEAPFDYVEREFPSSCHWPATATVYRMTVGKTMPLWYSL